MLLREGRGLLQLSNVPPYPLVPPPSSSTTLSSCASSLKSRMRLRKKFRGSREQDSDFLKFVLKSLGYLIPTESLSGRG